VVDRGRGRGGCALRGQRAGAGERAVGRVGVEELEAPEQPLQRRASHALLAPAVEGAQPGLVLGVGVVLDERGAEPAAAAAAAGAAAAAAEAGPDAAGDDADDAASDAPNAGPAASSGVDVASTGT